MCMPSLDHFAYALEKNHKLLHHSSFSRLWLCLCVVHVGVPEQATVWFRLGLGLAVEEKPTEHLCTFLFLALLLWQFEHRREVCRCDYGELGYSL